MELLNQPFTGQWGNRLIELLESSDYESLDIVVAFAKSSGVLRVKDSIEKFRNQGGVVNVYVGVDMKVTSYEALTSLFLHTDSLNIVHFEKGQTFHPKIYQFIGKDKSFISVGSHNLTAGGLWTNIESSILIKIDEERTNNTLLLDVRNYIEKLTSLEGAFMPIRSQDDIEKLFLNGYIVQEVTQKINRKRNNVKNEEQKVLFSQNISVGIPSISKSKDTHKTSDIQKTSDTRKTSDTQKVSETIWFETRKMTGGSRNILDLSKRSLLVSGNPIGTSFDLGEEKFIRGGVEFFGLDPLDTTKSKNITLNFEGVDYFDNTILYPEGKKANGTWRMQIKGNSSSGRGITEAFRAKGDHHYLVGKVISFTKIQSDYYLMSVSSESNLEDFKESSSILAKNGSNNIARWFGILEAT